MLHTYRQTYRQTDRHTDPLTKWVVEELSLLKSVVLAEFSVYGGGAWGQITLLKYHFFILALSTINKVQLQFPLFIIIFVYVLCLTQSTRGSNLGNVYTFSSKVTKKAATDWGKK